MSIKEIILHSGESVYVDFKQTAYKPEIFFDFIKDVMAMANAPVEEDRFLIVGVKHYVNNDRDIIGLTPDDLLDDAVYHKLLHDHIEPPIPFECSYVMVGEKMVGVFRIYNTQPPYMMRKDFERGKQKLLIGDSFIRVGTTTARVRRADIDQMFARRLAADPFAGKIDVQLEVDGQLLTTARTCSVGDFPSEAARQKITHILEEKREKLQQQQAAEALRKQQASENWSTHAISQALQQMQFPKGVDLSGMSIIGSNGPSRYEDRSIEQLEENLQHVKETYREEDLYAKFEEKAHKLNFIVLNNSEQYVEDCSLTITLQHGAGVDIATKIIQRPQPPSAFGYTPPRPMPMGYPFVEQQADQYLIRDSIKSLKHGIDNRAFQEPLRVFVPPQASGQQLRFQLTLTAKNLRKPVVNEVLLTIL
ncbi:AlbA family DNA-binding domain-containing protein [Hymenobacter cellulosivorans]|uniref:ATP-binding protein n=1 Tax=Hymenobacter cellulosivorans TaxID=2932249 RepID=A0ABY4F1Z7_9BACT|nr:ATP-binding protein [Hymenobacter cellulosivorans]UOQ50695.1 ATP-binding protein [Hymenobacter cellulosivorans]